MPAYRSFLEREFAAARELKRAFLARNNISRPLIAPAEPFTNSSSERARQLIKLLVWESTDDLVFLSKHLGARTHSAQTLRSQLSRYNQLQIRILVEGIESGPIYATGEIDWPHVRESALFELVQTDDGLLQRDGNASRGRIAVRVLPLQSPIHFAVSDRFGYRLEKNQLTAEALANLADPQTAQMLVEKFDALWDLSLPAQFPVPLRSAA